MGTLDCDSAQRRVLLAMLEASDAASGLAEERIATVSGLSAEEVRGALRRLLEHSPALIDADVPPGGPLSWWLTRDGRLAAGA